MYAAAATVLTAAHDTKMIDASDRAAWVLDGRIARVQSRDELELTVGTIERKDE